jgi:WD40 repeat protein
MAKRFALLEPRAAVTLDDYVRELAWAPDGRSLIAAGGEGKVFRVSECPERLRVQELAGHVPGTLAVAWSPRGAVFATSGQDGTLAVHRAEDGTELRRWAPARSWTEQLAWSPDGSVLASSAGRGVSLWSADGESRAVLPAQSSSVAALGWDRGGRELAVAGQGGVRVHRLEGATVTSARELPADGACLSVAWSANGKILASGMQNGKVHFWYLGSGRNSEMSGYGSRVALTAWSANSRYFATSAAAEVVVWDFGGKGPEGTRPAQLTGHTERVESLAWQPNGVHLASGGRDWRLSLWIPGKSSTAIDAHLAEGEVTSVRWSPDGRYLAVGAAQGTLALYALVEG